MELLVGRIEENDEKYSDINAIRVDGFEEVKRPFTIRFW